MTRSNPRIKNLSRWIGDVAGQIGGVAVRLPQHSIAVVPELGGPEPGGPILFKHQALVGQQCDRLVHRATLFDGGLAVPLVKDDAHRGQGGLDHVEDPVCRPSTGISDIVGTVVDRSQLCEVLALITVFGDSGSMVAGQKALAQLADLPAGVVDVVLAAHLIAGPGQHPGQCIPVTRPPPVAHVDRPGRVGGNELHQDPLAVAEIGAGVAVFALPHHVDKGLVQPPAIETKIDESWTGDLDGDGVGRRVGGELRHQGLGQFSRIAPRLLGLHQDDVGGPIPVLAPGRSFQKDVAGIDGNVQASVGGHLGKGAADGCGELVTNGHVVGRIRPWKTRTGDFGVRTATADYSWWFGGAVAWAIRPGTSPARCPRSSADRALASEAMCAGSIPAGGTDQSSALSRAAAVPSD